MHVNLTSILTESPIEMFDRILSWQYYMLRMIGLDGFSKQLSVNILTLGIFFLASMFMVVSFYDLFVLFRKDLLGKTFVLTTICFGFIGWGRLVNIFTHRNFLPVLMQMARATYVRGTFDRRQTFILEQYTSIYMHGVLLYSTVFLVGVIIASVGPAMIFQLSGETILPFGVYLPFVDPNSETGYELNYLYQLSCMLWTPPGLTATQNIYFALILNICIQYDVLQLHLEDLNLLIQETSLMTKEQVIAEKLREIIINQQRLAQFVNSIESVFSIVTIIEVLSMTFQLVLTLFVMRSKLWPPGIFLIPLCTIQLFIMCVPGTIIDIKASKLTERMYSVTWHELHAKNKRIYQLLLHRSQHPRCLTCAGMVNMDMHLFMSVVKKVYSITERALGAVKETVGNCSVQRDDLRRRINEKYLPLQKFIPTDLKEELELLDLSLTSISATMEDYQTAYKRTKLIRTDYFTVYDRIKMGIENAEMIISKHSVDPSEL
ncbi:putative odorant receptor 83c [Anopheles nili]|uniref:putative odorant receptor 83c n=1 Tax=Anopheles nili TaxID=185578 RepID=UPI00237AF74F|nr:putative odorant receptor 83c [Anopheles nili]